MATISHVPDFETPFNDNESVDRSDIDVQLRQSLFDTHDRMQKAIYQERFKLENRKHAGGTTHKSPKAVYKAAGQTKGMFTRAWLSYGPYEQVNLITDEIEETGVGVKVVEDSQTTFLSLVPYRNLTQTDVINDVIVKRSPFTGLSPEEQQDLWVRINRKLDLIDFEIASTEGQHVAPEPDEAWPTSSIPTDLSGL